MAWARWSLLVVGVAAVSVMGGCSDGHTADTAPRSSAVDGFAPAEGALAVGLPEELGVVSSVELSCAASIDAEVPDDFRVVSDVVALPASPRYPYALQTAARTADDGSVYYFAKTGLVWTGGHIIEVAVPDELRSTLAIGWGGPAQPARTVRVNCAKTSGWVALPGGYWATEPSCVEILVRVDQNTDRVRIGLGQPCDDQDPPAGPSDG